MYEYNICVRGYELDSYNHVNHSVYLNYLEQARWEILKSRDILEYFKNNKLLLYVIDIHIRFSRELVIFDEIVIKTEVTREEPYLKFNHKIFNTRNNLKICQAEVKTLLVGEDKIPYDIPDNFFKII